MELEIPRLGEEAHVVKHPLVTPWGLLWASGPPFASKPTPYEEL
jgi:hypothetical protein